VFEEIQDVVEQRLMQSQFLDVAKCYILYRNEQAQKRKPNIFEKRINLKPYEYPDLYEYVAAIRHSYWIHSEFNFTSDIQDFKTKLTDKERSAIKNTMLAISQIEVAVKSFWGDIYQKILKPEVGSVGATFGESEVRQISGQEPALLMVYPVGNFIHASEINPFFQLGETKYGKPILDRLIRNETSLGDAARCALVSFDSTMKSDLTVGPPIDLVVYKKDSIQISLEEHLQFKTPFFSDLSSKWSEGLRNLFKELPKFAWEID
jgi:hypothetical protein